jgi:hypothetical protein
MRNPAITLIIFLMFSCSEVPDTKILCDCYSERIKKTYVQGEGKYYQEPSCLSEITGLINENDNKFQIKKNGGYFDFTGGYKLGRYINWRDSKILAQGVDVYGEKIFFSLDRVNLKSYLLTTYLYEKPTEVMGTISFIVEQNYQCRVVEGV